ncbi:major capsid protein [uncultured Tateyamaria sp.]|uniref:major capsid protein n=1 Tax=uncultured Tateyamaria sp. TaxID=455651 RepID=UPI0026218E5E|nr:major capsid protein [uncultured Tateyamaria sp.]
MMQRGGKILSTGSIGQMKVLRQQLVRPGETLDCRLTGDVTMESLRERDALRINAHVAAFMTPVRWIEPEWSEYVREGPTTTRNISYVDTQGDWCGLGGNTQRSIPRFFVEAPRRIYNEWYKWPEDDDFTYTFASVPGQISLIPPTFRCVNLEHSWTRMRNQALPEDASNIEVAAAANTMSVVDLAETQARFRSAVQREVLTYGRYMEVMKELFGAPGSREVDQVPIKLDDDSVGVNPRSIPATDGPSLGQWQSLYDFNVNFSFDLTAPEHCVLTYILVVRFAPITEEVHPLSNNRLSWAELVGDAGLLSAMPPQPVETADVFDVFAPDSAPLGGYLPAGWQWRAQNNIIGDKIDSRKSFPVLRNPTTLSQCRDATRRVDAFRSSSLEDFRIDLYASEQSESNMANALSSHYVGMKDAGKGDGSPYPKQGKLK